MASPLDGASRVGFSSVGASVSSALIALRKIPVLSVIFLLLCFSGQVASGAAARFFSVNASASASAIAGGASSDAFSSLGFSGQVVSGDGLARRRASAARVFSVGASVSARASLGAYPWSPRISCRALFGSSFTLTGMGSALSSQLGALFQGSCDNMAACATCVRA